MPSAVGLFNIATAPADAHFTIQLNIIAPFMPITSDGKEPDFEPFLDTIRMAVGKAVRKATLPHAGGGKTQKNIVLDNLETVIADVSGDGKFRLNPRQFSYQLPPL